MDTRRYRSSIYKSKKKKKKFTLKRFLIAICVFALAYAALFFIVTPERAYKPAIAGNKPFVIAHRGGATLAPENTLVAFNKAKSLGVDMLEFDVRMTKDEELVVIHDPTVDRTTDGTGEVHEMTLAEIKELDAGYTFRDIRGNYLYRGQGVEIPTLEEVFEQFGDMKMVIELKVQSPPDTEMIIEKKLWELIEAYDMQHQVVVASYMERALELFNTFAEGSVALGASEQELTKFVFLNKLFLDRVYRPNRDVFFIPTEYNFFSLKDQRLINEAHRLNIKVIYWTINDEPTMRELIQKGVDGMITDRPDLFMRLLNEMEDDE